MLPQTTSKSQFSMDKFTGSVPLPCDSDDEGEFILTDEGEYVPVPASFDTGQWFTGKRVPLPETEEDDGEPRRVVRERDYSRLSPDVLADREKRRSLCGLPIVRRVRGEDRYIFRGNYSCGLWHNGFCPRCANWRALRSQRQVASAYVEALKQGKKLFSVVLLGEKAPHSLIHRAGKDKYIRAPQEGTEFITYEEFLDPRWNREEVTPEWMAAKDWHKFSNTPGTRNMTGLLGKEKVVVTHDDDIIEISTQQFAIDPEHTTPAIERKALEEACADDKAEEYRQRVNNASRDEIQEIVQEALDHFINLYKRRIIANGGKILNLSLKRHRERVRISSISWLKYTTEQIEEMIPDPDPPPKIVIPS